MKVLCSVTSSLPCTGRTIVNISNRIHLRLGRKRKKKQNLCILTFRAQFFESINPQILNNYFVDNNTRNYPHMVGE